MRFKVFLIVLFLIFLMDFVPAPIFDSVYWNTTEVIEGQPVKLIVEGGLDGHEISFQIFERDAGGTDDIIISNPPNIIWGFPDTSTTWIAKWQSDTDEGQINPPEYYFIATAVGFPVSMTSSTSDADMLKVYTCGDGICNGAETCSTCPADCVICAGTCDLTSASWNVTDVLEGRLVRLNLDGTDCDGETITFEIREDDFLSSDFVANPTSITYGSPNNYGIWITQWVDDKTGLQDNPPEYYFIASVQGTSKSITSSRNYDEMLKVEETIQCTGINYCSDYIGESICESDMCDVGEGCAPGTISCGEAYNSATGCTDIVNCGCSWNNNLGVCESSWDSKSDCPPPAGQSVYGTCSYTEDSGDTCENDEMLSRFLIHKWTWAPGNEITQSDPLNQQQNCADVQEVLSCPSSGQVSFFGIYNIIIAATIILLIYVGYFIYKKKKNFKKKRKNKKI
jgi:hypothetical protein